MDLQENSILNEKSLFLSYGESILELRFNDLKEEDMFILSSLYKSFEREDSKEGRKTREELSTLFFIADDIKKILIPNLKPEIRVADRAQFKITSKANKKLNKLSKLERTVDYNDFIRDTNNYHFLDFISIKLTREDVMKYENIFKKSSLTLLDLQGEQFFWVNVCYVLISKIKLITQELLKK